VQSEWGEKEGDEKLRERSMSLHIVLFIHVLVILKGTEKRRTLRERRTMLEASWSLVVVVVVVVDVLVGRPSRFRSQVTMPLSGKQLRS
jgi:hypothetical protein